MRQAGEELWKQMGLRLSEYERILEILGREPNETELGIFSAMWSEHCGYKHSKKYLRLLPSRSERVFQGPGENAGVVLLGNGTGVALKVESHNHPSAVEPFQGAATGIGGILRDILTMGARPICFLDSLRFGPADDGIVRYLMDGVVSGISFYGNCVGIPTVAGEVSFNESFRGNPLVNVMCVGVIPDPHSMARGVTGDPGNVVMVVGSKTGRDGIRGAAFASLGLSEDSQKDRPSVQIGDPFTGKLLIEACLEVIARGLIVGIQDMGAAGLTSSASEMAGRSGTGMIIDLDLVPKREEGMTPYEIMLSESQERMLIVAEQEKVQAIMECFERWGLDAAVVGKVTADGRLRLLEKGAQVADIPVDPLVSPPVYDPPAERPAYMDEIQYLDTSKIPAPDDLGEALKRLMGRPNIASKRWVYEQYDYLVGTDTVASPGAADAAVLRIKDSGDAAGTEYGVAVTIDCNSRYCFLDPRRGAMQAVLEASRNLSMVGAEPIAITDCLNFGNPERPEVYWQFQESIRGLAHVAESLGIPVVSGNVSFYNECDGGKRAVFPSPAVGMVGEVEDVRRIASSAFKDEGDIIFLVGPMASGLIPFAGENSAWETPGSGAEEGGEIGGSEYLEMVTGEVRGLPPAAIPSIEAKVQALIRSAIRDGKVKSAHDCAEGGLAVAIAECCIQGDRGARIILEEKGRADFILFGETQSRAIVTLSPADQGWFEEQARNAGVPVRVAGKVSGEDDPLVIDVVSGGSHKSLKISVDELREAWEGTIPGLFDDDGDVNGGDGRG